MRRTSSVHVFKFDHLSTCKIHKAARMKYKYKLFLADFYISYQKCMKKAEKEKRKKEKIIMKLKIRILTRKLKKKKTKQEKFLTSKSYIQYGCGFHVVKRWIKRLAVRCPVFNPIRYCWPGTTNNELLVVSGCRRCHLNRLLSAALLLCLISMCPCLLFS